LIVGYITTLYLYVLLHNPSSSQIDLFIMLKLKQLLIASLIGSAGACSNSSQVVSTVSEASCACTKLSTLYTDKLLYPNATDYTAEATAYWDLRADLSPACIFLPTTAEEVASAVAELVACNAQFAVRGGGHMNVRMSNPLMKPKG
jgi:hypothetical protein